MNEVRGRTDPKLKVRLRHRWVTLITLPLSEEQASLMADGGVEAIKPLGEKTVNYTDPLCWRCEQEWGEQTYSCPGEAASKIPASRSRARLSRANQPRRGRRRG